MKLLLQRFKDDGDATLGRLFEVVNGVEYFICYTLEDEFRKVKVKGETRIPEGTYEIKKRPVLSGLTVKYQKKFPWFKWHLQLQDVPGFNYVYLHVGNKDEHTDGCILVGMECSVTEMVIWRSVQAFKPLYLTINEKLEKEQVFITIEDG